MIVAQAQRDRLQQRLHALSPEAAAEAAAAAEALAGGQGGGGGDGDVVRAHLERIAELEAEVKRLKQVSRCGAPGGRVGAGAGLSAMGRLVAILRGLSYCSNPCRGVSAELGLISTIAVVLYHPDPARRMSGAFAASMRRQSLAPGGGGGGGDLPGSPFPLSPLAQSDGEDELGDTAELSALQLHDDEYVARGQAHRCAA